MITRDRNSNIGFDFDFNLEIDDDEENYTPAEIRHIMKNAIDQVASKYGYKRCEDSTRVLTIKKVNIFTCQILHSCDFALVYNCNDGRQQYIHWLQSSQYWEEFLKYYLTKKNNNNDPDKHSRSILAESVNEMYQKNETVIKPNSTQK